MAGRKAFAAGFAALALLAVVPGSGLAATNDPLRISRPVNMTKDDLAPTRTYGSPFLLARFMFSFTSPLTDRMSSQPSLSTSNQAVPKPVYGRLGRRMPNRML